MKPTSRARRAVSCHVAGFCFLLTVGTVPGLAFAQDCDLPAKETGTVASIVDGDTLGLEDGRTVRLLAIMAPKPPLDWAEGTWPFEAEAKDALAKIVSGARVELRFDERREDRYGRVLAHVFLMQDGRRIWLQEKLARLGFARVYAQPDLSACIAPLLVAEGTARAARRGLWRSFAYRIRDARDPGAFRSALHTYQLVEGMVHGLGEGRRRIYINFAEDWRDDFTAILERKNLARFEAAGLDLADLAGKRVLVRGWVEWLNGPMIALSHPEQIEVLPSSASGS